jgi:hypothetical protein
MVGTVGTLTVHPNMVNIVPGEVELLADFRGIHPAAIAETLARFEAGIAEVARGREVTVDVAPIVREEPLHIDAEMIQHAAAAESVRVPFGRLTSGASHDANHLARLCPIGMLFIACRDGHSHCPEEWAETAYLAAGSRVLLELVLRLDAALAEPSPTPQSQEALACSTSRSRSCSTSCLRARRPRFPGRSSLAGRWRCGSAWRLAASSSTSPRARRTCST